LNYTIDSLDNILNTEKKSNTDNLTLRVDNIFKFKPNDSIILPSAPEKIVEEFTPKNQQRILQSAIDYVNNISFNAESNDLSITNQIKKINDHYLALYEKFVIAFSCFLMFYIGAPLGAIIRKGGLGLPIVFAVIIFIVYHFINTFGRKLAQEDGIVPFLGSWVGAFTLTPLAIFLTYKATNDSGIINFDSVFDPITKLFKKKHTKQ
jgi:lipopolysaccharide export system permease protein